MNGHIKSMFNGVKPKWIKLIKNELKASFLFAINSINTILKEADIKDARNMIRPNPCDVLKAFKYTDIDDVKVVILGQDPYPELANATGLSFSVPKNSKIPASLKHILSALDNSGYKLRDGNLAHWASQGVMLLNMYLTRTPTFSCGKVLKDKNPLLHEFWSSFTVGVIKNILLHNPNCIFVLWGKVAQDKVEPLLLENKCKYILKWSHPSPTKQNTLIGKPTHFSRCDHFIRINTILETLGLPKIDFAEPKKTDMYVATDGGATGIMTKTPTARYGLYIPKMCMNVENYAYEVKIGAEIGAFEIRLTEDKTDFEYIGVPAKPTNNRGELMAILCLFLLLIKEKVHGKKINIIADSKYAICAVRDWMTNWKVRDRTLRATDSDGKYIVKNPDIIQALLDTYALVLIDNDVNFIHIKSHQDCPTDPYEQMKWTLNDTADKLCS